MEILGDVPDEEEEAIDEDDEINDSSTTAWSRRWRPPDFPACCHGPGSAKEKPKCYVRRRIHCAIKKLQENEMFQN